MPEIIKTVNEVIMQMAFLDTPPQKTEYIKEDLNIDSLRLVEFIMKLEETFMFEIDISDLNPEMLKTVEDMYNLIFKYKGNVYEC